MTEAHAAQAYRPAVVSPAAARLLNGLVTRGASWPLRLGGAEARLTPLLRPVSFAPAALLLAVDSGEAPWRIGLSRAPVRLHSALREADPELLPAPLRQAVLEVLAGPLLADLARLFDQPVRLTGSVLYDGDGRAETEPVPETWPDPLCEIGFRLDAADLEEPLFARVGVPDAAGARRLHEALWKLPVRKGGAAPGIPDCLPALLAVEAGRMRLSAAELRALEPGDILFPEDFPALRNEVTLRVGSEPGPVWTALCDIADRAAVVRTPPAAHSKPEETIMSETSAVPGAPADAPAFSPDDLELTLSFELERRSVAIKELAALAPGFTFALGADPAAPVTLRAGGKAIGSGRLVDLHGTLGVQITALDGRGETR